MTFADELKNLQAQVFSRLSSSQDLSGQEICQEITSFIDWVIEETHSQVNKIYGPRDDISVIALGGYGRSELNPYSDIDILFLHGKEDPKVQDFIGKILYILWDMKLTLGHSSRTLKNVQSMAQQDIKFKTSLIHHRLVSGNSNHYDRFSSLVIKIFQSNRYHFYTNLLDSMNFHGQNLGESVLLKEPNVKESLGALRGIHLVRWLGYNFFQCDSLSDLAKKNLIDSDTIDRIENHLNFFLVLRNDLHFQSGRKEDKLLLEHQETLAKTLRPADLTDDKEYMHWLKKTIESGMRSFYLKAREVFHFVQRMMDLFEIEANNYRQFSRFLKKRKFLSDKLLLINNKLYSRHNLDNSQFLPKTIMEIFIAVQRHGSRLSQELEQFISSNLSRIDHHFRADLEGFQLFEKILRSERNLYHTLSIMQHNGFLSRYLPYFDELECTVQHDYYHAYTVDEHTLQGINVIERLYNNHDINFAFYKRVLQNCSGRMRFLLLFAIFYHDIGKGRPGNHVLNGIPMIHSVVETFPFTDDEKESIEFLVNNHLIMIRNSQQRDIHDPRAIYQFTEKVRRKDRLDLLFLLSYADMASVAPKTFTFWKGELLIELYNKTLSVLESTTDGSIPDFQESDYREIISELLTHIPPEKTNRANEILDSIDKKYFIEQDKTEILKTVNWLMDHGGQLSINYDYHQDYYKLTCYASDRVGFFTRITLALAMNGIMIHSVNLYSKINGYVITHFNVGSIYSGQQISDSRWNIIEKDIQQLLDSDITQVSSKIKQKRKSFPPGKKQSIIPVLKVNINNELSNHYSIIEIKCLDSLGLLFNISRTLNLCDINIKSAHITTHGNMAIDTFYVEDKAGGKIQDNHILDTITQALIITITNITLTETSGEL